MSLYADCMKRSITPGATANRASAFFDGWITLGASFLLTFFRPGHPGEFWQFYQADERRVRQGPDRRHSGALVGLVFLSHQIGGAASTYLAGRLFDVRGSYTRVFLAVIAILLLASAVSWAVQERRYSLKYQSAVG